MRAGDVVWYAEEPGTVVQATVTAVAGRGPSMFKVLNLRTAAGRDVRNVPHVRDCHVAAGYWCQNETEVRVVTRDTTEWQADPVTSPRLRRRAREAPVDEPALPKEETAPATEGEE